MKRLPPRGGRGGASESERKRLIRLRLGELGILVMNNAVGTGNLGGHVARFGLGRGSSDLICVLPENGRIMALEVKTPRGRLSPEQRLFLELIRKFGGFAAVVRTAEEAEAAAARAREGLKE